MTFSLKRRQFLSLGSLLLTHDVFAVDPVQNIFLSAATDHDDQHYVFGFTAHPESEAVQSKFSHALPGRAHQIAIHKASGLFAVVARRPGNWMWLGDLATGDIIAKLQVPDDRHLYGHGVFSRNGRYFYTTESAFRLVNGDSGRVVKWKIDHSVAGVKLERISEFPSYGTGPHELLLMPDQEVLVVANGGIRTHPDSGREKLNIESMQPSLAYINASTGALMDQITLDPTLHKASIRHLDLNHGGLVAAALQYEGEPFEVVPLLFTHKRGEAARLLEAPWADQQQMKQYVGSVRFDSSGEYIAASCPRGNRITFWKAADGSYQGAVSSRDGCGICAVDKGFIYTAGSGRITTYDMVHQKAVELMTDQKSGMSAIRWDNHLTSTG